MIINMIALNLIALGASVPLVPELFIALDFPTPYRSLIPISNQHPSYAVNGKKTGCTKSTICFSARYGTKGITCLQ